MRKIMNEKLTITTSNPVRARFYEYPRFTYPWHFHSEYEIIYVEKGEGDCLVVDSNKTNPGKNGTITIKAKTLWSDRKSVV